MSTNNVIHRIGIKVSQYINQLKKYMCSDTSIKCSSTEVKCSYTEE